MSETLRKQAQVDSCEELTVDGFNQTPPAIVGGVDGGTGTLTEPLEVIQQQNPAVITQHRLDLNGPATFNPTAQMTGYSFRVVSGAPTYTDSAGNVTALQVNEVSSFDSDGYTLDTTPVLTLLAGDQVVVQYTSL